MARPKDPRLRARILTAAAREFAARGFRGASLERIGRRAGVTKGGVYFHFRSKEDLFFAALDEQRAGRREVVPGARSPSDSAAGALEAFLTTFLQFHLRQPEAHPLVRLLHTELRAGFTTELRGDARAEMRELRARLRELFADGQRDGSLLVEDPALGAFLVAGTVEGVLEQWRVAPRDAEPFGGPASLAGAIVAPYVNSRPGPTGVPAEPDDDFQPPF